MEFKWLMICVAVSIVGISAAASISEWARYNGGTECRIGYAQSDRSADEIQQICN